MINRKVTKKHKGQSIRQDNRMNWIFSELILSILLILSNSLRVLRVESRNAEPVNKSPNSLSVPPCLRGFSNRSAGFTLAELMIVITVIVLLFTVVMPNVGSMLTRGRMTSAISAISAGVSAARTNASLPPAFRVGTFQGAAIIVTPQSELRIVRHDDSVVDGSSNKLIEKDPPLAGYKDVGGQDYISIPQDAGIVGIVRTGSTATDRQLLAPPFAIRFDRYGHLIARQGADDAVYYDGNSDGKAVTSKTRTAPYGTTPYNADKWDPFSGKYTGDGGYDTSTSSPDRHTTTHKYKQPFEQLETVIGIIIYSKTEFWNAGNDLESGGTSGGINTTDRDWILSNGTPMFFNRYSGAIIKP